MVLGEMGLEAIFGFQAHKWACILGCVPFIRVARDCRRYFLYTSGRFCYYFY